MTKTLTTERLREILEHRSPSLRWGEAEKIAAELLANREAQPVAEIRNMPVSSGGKRPAIYWFGKQDMDLPVGTKFYTAPPAPAGSGVDAQSQLVAIVERLNASGYEVNGEGVDFTTASEAVGIVLQQLHDAVEAQAATPALAVPDERAEFESFIDKRFGELVDRRRAKNGYNEYMAWDMTVAWIVWQRRAAMLAQPVSQGCKLNSPEIPDGCQWTFDEHDYKWDSDCGEAWIFYDGGPTENGVKFCQGCGKPVLLAAAPGDH